VFLFVLYAEAQNWPTNVTGIITGYGYVCEEYTALTPDGYYLSLQRIPHGMNNKVTKGVVFFQHGLLDSSVGICLQPPSQGLPFMLADAGWDVWLGNNRGNGYSMSNMYFNPNQAGFWNFTWDQMASQDFPTQINFVLQQTGAKKLAYIGHSEGTTQAFAGLIENPSLANKISIFIALAPVAYVHHTGSLLLRIMADFDMAIILALLGDNEFYLPSALHYFLPDICRIDPSICTFSLDIVMGPSTNLNTSNYPYIMNYEPNDSSVLNLIQWSQGVATEAFQKMDYGYAGNMARYGQPTPPPYPLNKFPPSLPLALFTGSNDYLADPADVATLVQQISNNPVLIHNEPTYAHVDFLWATNAYTKIYPSILNLVAQYAP